MKKYNTTNSSKNKNYDTIITYALAFLIPLVFLVVMLVMDEVYPFGDNCILHVDMYHQYEPFFTELANKLQNGGSLMYSWNLGIGSDFVALIAYYLASPFNILLLFWPMDNIIEAMTVIIILKMCLSGVTFVSYMRYHFKKNDYSYVFFSLFYVFSGYMAAYYWDIMWLDGVMLTPLVLIGLEKLVWEDKPHMYTFVLGITILCNFYIGYMICVFQVIWFAFQFINLNDKTRKIIVTIRFAIFSVIAGCFGAVLMIPEALILQYSSTGDASFPDAIEGYFSIMQELSRMNFDVEPYTAGEHWPNLYCGMAIFVFLTLYFTNATIKKRDKIVRAVVIVFFLVSFCINILDYIWHGFHFPNSLPGRQVFLFGFLLLAMGQEAYLKMKENRPRDFLIALLTGTVFIAMSYVWGEDAFVESKSITLSAVILCGYIMLFFFLNTCKRRERKVFFALIVTMLVVECFANYKGTGFYTTSRVSYTSDWEPIKLLVDEAKDSDESFWRMEKEERRTKNDAMIYGYRSSTIFSSTMNVNIGSLYDALGMESGMNFFSDSGSTALTEALLSVKYFISDDPTLDSSLKHLKVEADGYYLYQNEYVLPIGYCIPSNLEENWDDDGKNPVDSLNDLTRELGGSFDYLSQATGEMTEGAEKSVFVPEEDGYYYATYDDENVTVVSIKKGDTTRKYTKADHGFILDFGYCKAGEAVTVTYDYNDKISLSVYKMNEAVLDEVYDNLSANSLKNITYSDTEVTGDIEVPEGEDLLLTIPYEAGWKLYVDGEEYEKSSFMDALTLVKLGAGKHTIRMSYFTPGLISGVLISGFAFLFAAITLFIRKINVEKFNKK